MKLSRSFLLLGLACASLSVAFGAASRPRVIVSSDIGGTDRTDDPSPAMAEGIHHGARSVSQWREDYLRDFAARMERCAAPGRR